MKTIPQLQSEIKSITDYLHQNQKYIPSEKIKKQKNKIEFLRFIIKYLEFNPTENFIKSEQERISKIIDSKTKQYKYWKENNAPLTKDVKYWPAIYNNESGLNSLKQQLKTINYILENE